MARVAEVLRLFIALIHRQPMRELEATVAIENRGLQGCAHGRAGSRRQVLLMEMETLEELGLQPGVVKENITTRGLALRELRAGQRLHVGEAMLEVASPCEPCRLMDEIRSGLRCELHGRRGTLCRVVQGGVIRRFDKIEVLDFMRVGN